MNVFVIPSWYPSTAAPIAGIFIKEQAEAVAALQTDARVVVSRWGHDDANITVRKPLLALSRLARRLRQRSCLSPVEGVHEAHTPTLTWSHKLPFGGVRQLLRPNRRNLRMAANVVGHIDVIHAHVSYPAGFIASLLSEETGIPYVLTEHMSPFPFAALVSEGRPIPEIHRAFDHASSTIAVSPSLADRIASFGYKRPIVIPNLINERRFSPAARSASGKFVFFTLCGISSQKGIDILLEAIRRWEPAKSEVEFRIGGDGSLRAEYMRLAERLGVADRVQWLGAVSRDDAPLRQQGCDCYVMPSRHETFGVAYVEAIATGKPVIATRSGGPEFIVNAINGLLVNVSDVDGLSSALSRMVREATAYDPHAIRQDFERRFSRPVVVKQLWQVYSEVVGA